MNAAWRQGTSAQVDLLQSRVEAQQFQADVMAAQGELRAAEVAMAQLLGPEAEPTFDVVGDLKSAPLALDVPRLLAALEQRPDVRAAATRVQGAERQIASAEAKRVVDISLGAGWQHSFAASLDDGLPAADFLSGSLSVPLPFSRIYKGELEAARHTHRQTQSQLQAVRARAQGECARPLPIPGSLRASGPVRPRNPVRFAVRAGKDSLQLPARRRHVG